jgi:hypothetical protein
MAVFGASLFYGIPGSGSGSRGVAANAAAACVRAANAADEFGAGTRSASSTRVELADAEKSLQIATRRYVGYADIVRSVGAVRDDVAAGSRAPSPQNVNYLNTVCGPPAGARI